MQEIRQLFEVQLWSIDNVDPSDGPTVSVNCRYI